MRLPSALLALCAPAVALAVPMQFTHQGRLNDASGAPLTGAHNLTVSLYDGAGASSPLWTETISATLEAGVYAIVLGANESQPIDSGLFTGNVLWLGLSVDADAELPDRIAIVSVPYAVRAEHAAVADALSRPVDWSEVVGAPLDADTLGDLACEIGEVASWSGTDWACAVPSAPTVDASTLTGTIPISNLPVGGGENDVAAGDHVHSFGQITGQAAADQLPVGPGARQVAAGDHGHVLAELQGDLPVARLAGDLPLTRTTGDLPVARLAGDLPLSQTSGSMDIGRTTGNIPYTRLPVGTVANTVAAGNHTHTAAQVGALPIGGGTLTGTVNVQGRVGVGDDGQACASATAGSLKYEATEGALYFCNGADWILVSGSVGTQARPGDSCQDILDRGASTGNGAYWIRVGGRSFQVYCDMTTDGGGWTRFWWHAQNAGLSGFTDMLAQELWECSPTANRCFARMPITAPVELHVQNELGRWATWTFATSNNTSDKIRAAFTARTTTTMANACGNAFNASRQSSGYTESPYRCDEGTSGAADNCDCFWYDTYTGIKSFSFDDDTGWAETAFGAGYDNNNALGVDALETGGYRNNAAANGVWLYYR